jgi:hypothetical protein
MTERTPNPSAVVAGRLCEVLYVSTTGGVLVQDATTLESRWVDYYTVNYIDLTKEPGAVLRAMSTILNEETADEPGKMVINGAEA